MYPRQNWLIWLADKIAGFFADLFVGALFSEPRNTSGAWPDFRYARSAVRDGDLHGAIELTKGELEKEPENYEGLMLLASLYAETGKPARSIGALEKIIGALEKILSNPNATDEQKRVASAAKAAHDKRAH
jgi:hypothetical protein